MRMTEFACRDEIRKVLVRTRNDERRIVGNGIAKWTSSWPKTLKRKIYFARVGI